MAYNSAHCKTCCVAERCFGLLKSRFPCLDKTGGILLYMPSLCFTTTASTIASRRPLIQMSSPATPPSSPLPCPLGNTDRHHQWMQ